MEPKTSRRTGTAPTLSDVARAAGVSPMTVSRVINRDGKVRPQTRERIEAAIETLRYAPNPAARLLAGAVQTRILLLYGNPSSAYLSEVLLGCLAGAGITNSQLMLEKCADGGQAETIARAVEGGFDGVILPPPFCGSHEIIAVLQAARIPTALIATGAPVPGACAVTIDDERAATDMTRHLIGLGHRRIGFVVGNSNQTASRKRLEGFRLAIQQADLPDDPALFAEGDFSYRSGLRAAEQLLDLAVPPTAIFASNDDMAAAVVATAHRRHLDVPTDLSVCGFDDTALATTISPELTTVRQPVAEMAQAAVEMLAAAARERRFGRDASVEHRLFGHEIIRRQSDASASEVLPA